MPHEFEYTTAEHSHKDIKRYVESQGYTWAEVDDSYIGEGLCIVGGDVILQEPYSHFQLDKPIGQIWCRARAKAVDYDSSKKLFEHLKRRFQARNLVYRSPDFPDGIPD